MAVTINQLPSYEYKLSGNPLVFVFSSNQTAQPNFSYYVEVYIDAVLNSSHQVFPESGIYGKFDASQIVESELTAPSIPTDINGVSGGALLCELKVYERYGTIPALQASELTGTISCIKGKLFMNDWINTDLDIYTVLNNGGGFLTQCPEFYLREGELLNYYFTVDSYSSGYDISLTYKDSSGSTLNTQLISNSGYLLNAFSVGWDILDGYYSLDSVSTVEVFIENIDSVYSETYVINILSCSVVDKERLHFLNQLGGVDSFTFDAVSKKSMTTQTNSFLTTQGGFNGSGYDYSTTNSQTGNYQVTSNTKLMLESNWVNEDIMQWLNDNLFTSPYILLETDNGLQRVANTSASVKYKKNRNDMAFNVVIELDLEMHSSMII